MDVDEAIEQAKWRTSNYISPHQYFVYEQNQEAFRVIREAIKKDGVTGEFLGRRYKYLLHEGWKYWVMFPVINRARIEPEIAA